MDQNFVCLRIVEFYLLNDCFVCVYNYGFYIGSPKICRQTCVIISILRVHWCVLFHSRVITFGFNSQVLVLFCQ